jgi:hypothetical protein
MSSFPDQSTLVLNFTDAVRGYNALSRTLKIIDGPSVTTALPPPFVQVTDTWDLEAAVVDPANESIVRVRGLPACLSTSSRRGGGGGCAHAFTCCA